MSLAAPWGLLALLGIFVLIYFHRRSVGRRRVVPTVALWQPAPVAAGRFKRLVDPMLLVRALIVLCIALALARPTWPGHDAVRDILVVDASASMSAHSRGGTRFSLAQEEARRVLDRMPKGREAMVIRAGVSATVAADWSSDRRALTTAVATLHPGDAPKRLMAALALASRQREGHGGVVHLFSDTTSRDTLTTLAERAGLRAADVELHRVGEPADNVAIVRAAIVGSRRSPLDREVFALVASFAATPRSVDLVLERPDGRVERRPLTLAPGERRAVVLAAPSAERLVLRIDGAGDALAADDRVELILAEPPLRVLHVGGGDRHVEAALRAHPGLAITRVSRDDFRARRWGPEAMDVAVVEGEAPADLPVPALVMLPAASTTGGTTAGTTGRPSLIVDWERQHPLLRSLDLRDVVVPSQIVVTGPGERPLIRSTAGAVASASVHGVVRRVTLAFPVGASTLGDTPAFPILFARSLAWLAERPESAVNVAAGQPLDVPWPAAAAGTMTVRRPDGTTTSVAAHAGRLHVDDTEHVGRYLVSGAGIDLAFTVNLLDAGESATNRHPEPASVAATTATPGTGASPEPPFWPVRLALAIALQVMSLEIWLLQRRNERRAA